MNRRCFWVPVGVTGCALFAALCMPGCGEGGRARQSSDLPSQNQRFVVWRVTADNPRAPVMPFNTPIRPAKGASVIDPVYGTKITRVTDKAADGWVSPGIVNEYARFDPENAAGTRALLRGTDGTWYLYSVPGWQCLRKMEFRGNPDAEPRWDAVNPDLIYFVEGPSLWEHNIASGRDRLVHNFAKDQPGCAFARTHAEGDASIDRRYWCLQLDDEKYNTLSVVCYDKHRDKVVGKLTQFAGEFNHVGMDMSGTHCVIAYEATPPVVYHRDFTHPVTLPQGSSGHADFALDASGRDVYVFQNTATDWISMADLETGAETRLVPIPFDVNTDIGLHFSSNCDSRPGWVLVSTYGHNTVARTWMDRALFMVELRQDPVVWRIAQTFCLQGTDSDYFGEAFAAINRRGTRVWWGTNWNAAGSSSRAYETYVAELPPDWDARVIALAGRK